MNFSFKTPTAGENVEQYELSFIAGGKAKRYTHLEDSLPVFYKTKYNFTMWPDSGIPWYLPKVFKNVFSHKSLRLED